MDPLTTGLISFVVAVVTTFFMSFFTEKGKNFATKQDVAQITETEAKVHSQYDAKIETLRSELQKQLHIQKLSFEREFEILSKLWDSSVELRDSIPEDPTVCAGTDAEAEQRRIAIFERFDEKRKAFRDLYEKNRPFYPQEIYEILVKLLGNASVKSAFTINYEPGIEHYAILEKSRKELSELSDQLCNAVRKQFQLTI